MIPSPHATALAANSRHLALWTGAWVISLAVAAFAPPLLDLSTTVSAGLVGLDALVGLGMIAANVRLVRGLDELQQRVQLEAMALTLGLTIVAGLAYAGLDQADVIEHDAEIAYLMIFMSLTYLAATVAGERRYA